jgi:hypothetical protein
MEAGQLFDGTTLEVSIIDSTVRVNARGTEFSLADIGEQFAWLGAALRSSPYDNQMAHSIPQIITLNTYSTSHTKSRGIPALHFKLNFLIEDLDHGCHEAKRNGSCWHSLFKNAVVVRGYPILARMREEKGLEIPLNMMAALGQTPRITEFGGDLVMKGFSTMFVPTKRIGDSVLWHFLFNEDGSRMSYLCATNHYPNQGSISMVDISSLVHTRNFLGWTSSVTNCIGEHH